MDISCVVAGDSGGGEQAVEQTRPRVGELVEDQATACKLGMDGEKAGSRRRLEHEVGGRDRRGRARDETKPDRRGELLECLALLGAARMGGNERRQLGEHGEQRHRDAARSRIAGPKFRRNRICAASQASYAVFQVQAPSASEPLKAATIAVRSACASIAWPRSRSASSNLAAAASARPASDCKMAGVAEGAAAIAAVTKFEFMRDIQESEDGRNPGRALDPGWLKPVPAVLSLSVAAVSLRVGFATPT